ncbi:MOSC domain-containing protein [Rubrobacter indicoceani]|uniref:MOSC domain-containing protein n=1 Tax=Rubrobacter indicoceani TaxID=2051957 RepID=UPI000E5B57B4|nr:MOSC N-terminal beta barrel domain-containing protein [Rubrobacter indicoceani]
MNQNPASVTALHHYPVKSCAGTGVDHLTADAPGPVHDRRFMLVDGDSTFLSQRRAPELARVKPGISEGDHPELLVDAPGMEKLTVPLGPDGETGKRSRARIWRDTVEVSATTPGADEWFSQYLGARCRLVHLPETSTRPVDPDYGRAGDLTTLADGFPFLLISESSLEDLNSRLEDPVPMNRFRPNIVVSGTEPYEEDGWTHLRIGEMEFRVVKPCSRCVITTVDQATGKKGKEPLTTLATYRRTPRGVLFGQNLIHDAPGRISVGDRVEFS